MTAEPLVWPTTEAGHRFLDECGTAHRRAVVAIEQEARTAADAQLRVLREALRRLIDAAEDSDTHQHLDGPKCWPAVKTDDLLALLDAAADEPTVAG